jgi:flagellar basal-body rod modification protein FlgD
MGALGLMSTAVPPTGSATSSSPVVDRVPIQVLGQDDFLKLLVTQMTTQDPLNPQTDTQFISQMAQFSALEQAKSMQAEMAQLRADQDLIRAGGLLGKVVAVRVTPELVMEGTVSAVQVEAGTPKLIIEGEPYGLNQVITISPGGDSTLTSTLNNYARISQLGR